MEKKKKGFKVLKLNKETLENLNDQELEGIKGGILSIGATCSCNNSCNRDNVNPVCCC